LFRSRIGRTLLALQASEIAAETVGINVYRYKVLAFVLSSVCAGIGGVFFAHQNGFINSDSFVFAFSVSMLTSVLMGGTGSSKQYGVGVELGYLVAQNLWVSAGYNVFGYKDPDMAGADYTARGPFVRLRYKFDEALLGAAPEAAK